MPLQPIYALFQSAKAQGKKRLAVLVDPDQSRLDRLPQLVETAAEADVDFFFVGGSLLLHDQLEYCLDYLRQHSAIPAILFPGSPLQISKQADALLLLSLISGRNPELLIGHHVIAAPYLKASGIEIIPTGYMLIESGKPTSVSYMSNTLPIPAGKPDIAVCTAMAGEMLGLKLIYLDAGSGAAHPVPYAMTREVSQVLDIPLLVGGGLRTPEQVSLQLQAGADVVVIGNAFEKDPSLLLEIAACVHLFGHEAPLGR